MTYSKKCVNLIKEFEGIYLKSYLCPAGKATIGYGSTWWPDNKPVELGQSVTLQKSEDLLKFELDKIVSRLPVTVIYTQGQLDAVVSFIYNVGMANYINSKLYKKIKVNTNDPTIPAEFRKWTKARSSGKLIVLKGLVRRREAEIKLYLHNDQD